METRESREERRLTTEPGARRAEISNSSRQFALILLAILLNPGSTRTQRLSYTQHALLISVPNSQESQGAEQGRLVKKQSSTIPLLTFEQEEKTIIARNSTSLFNCTSYH